MEHITKIDAKNALGIETDADLARWFGVSRWAVGQWADHESLPVARQWELRAKRPDLFPVARGVNRRPKRVDRESPVRVTATS